MAKFEKVFKQSIKTEGKRFLGNEELVNSLIIGKSGEDSLYSEELERYQQIRSKFGFTDKSLHFGERLMIKNYVKAWFQQMAGKQVIHKAELIKKDKQQAK
jgi:hypothetical protein